MPRNKRPSLRLGAGQGDLFQQPQIALCFLNWQGPATFDGNDMQLAASPGLPGRPPFSRKIVLTPVHNQKKRRKVFDGSPHHWHAAKVNQNGSHLHANQHPQLVNKASRNQYSSQHSCCQFAKHLKLSVLLFVYFLICFFQYFVTFTFYKIKFASKLLHIFSYSICCRHAYKISKRNSIDLLILTSTLLIKTCPNSETAVVGGWGGTCMFQLHSAASICAWTDCGCKSALFSIHCHSDLTAWSILHGWRPGL